MFFILSILIGFVGGWVVLRAQSKRSVPVYVVAPPQPSYAPSGRVVTFSGRRFSVWTDAEGKSVITEL